MNTYLLGLLIVCATTILSVLGMLAVRKLVNLQTLLTYHEVAGYFLSIVGTLYAVLLGFIVVDSMQQMQNVRVLISTEASGLANIFLVADGLPAEKKTMIRGDCRDYAQAVIDDEWPLLQEGRYSQKTFHSVFRIWKEITNLDPATPRQQQLQQQLLSEICTMTENHRTRVISATRTVAPIMWLVLIVGGLFTIIFTYFFGVTSIRIQALMTALVAMTLSLNICLVYVFGHPMATDLGLNPGPFKLDLLIFDNFEKGDMPQSGIIPN
jgi:hypothetical protein